MEYLYKGSNLERSILLGLPSPVLKAKFMKLENGLKSASVGKQGLTAQLGLRVHAGIRFESSAISGVSVIISIMGYKPTAHLSHRLTVNTLAQLGAHAIATCQAGRQEPEYQVGILWSWSRRR